MPCEKCEKKWGKIITPEVWRDGAKSSHKNSKLGENKFLTKVTNIYRGASFGWSFRPYSN